VNEERGTRNAEQKLAPFLVPRSLFLVLLFLLARLPLLFVRQPFFDELFTRWICGRAVLPALQFDSGPPLYYWLIQLAGDPPLIVVRAISLLFATIAFVLVLRMNVTAAALLAVFPPAVLFAVDARAYALCAMLVAVAIVANGRDRPWIAAAALLLAAYSHYYGVLFFPLLWKEWRALLAAIALYIPGFWLAFHQPAAARAWMSLAWPDALFVRPPLLLAIVIGALVIAAIRPTRRALWTLIPLAAALVLGVYVPLRFEAVIAVPLMLWLAEAKKMVVIVPLGVAFGVWTVLGILDHAQRPIDDYRAAAELVAQAKEPVVASGYLYLETVSLRPAIAYPPEQALHPGWRVNRWPGSEPPRGAFLWIGERRAPELEVIRRTRRVEPLYANARALVVKVH
jgi:hypothetical protein